MSPETKQLKKLDFLNTVTEEPMTREELVDALESYTFLSSWLDYLIEHFAELGRIIKNDDGTIQRKAGKAGTGQSRVVYKVVFNSNGTFGTESKTLDPGETMNKDEGWAATEKRAVKNAVSVIFKQYQDDVKAVKQLLEADTAAATPPEAVETHVDVDAEAENSTGL